MLQRTNLMYNNYNCLSVYDNYPKIYYRCNSCDTNLTSNTPANQYQRQKIIQNTVRVPSSLYTMNVGSLSAYQKPSDELYNVNWNQMSDRKIPSVQKANASGTTYHSSSTRSSITRMRPGAMSPGGIGCDIKHNSYDRYLNKLKGKSVLRRGTIPYDFGIGLSNYKFNQAYPIYGGKTTKLNIVNGCNCPLTPRNDNSATDESVYLDNYVVLTDPYKNNEFVYKYKVNDIIHFYYDNIFVTGKIITILTSNKYLVEFNHNDKLKQIIVNYNDILNTNCNCVKNCEGNEVQLYKYYDEDGVLRECEINYNNVYGITV
jgi:hypothetical protein